MFAEVEALLSLAAALLSRAESSLSPSLCLSLDAPAQLQPRHSGLLVTPIYTDKHRHKHRHKHKLTNTQTYTNTDAQTDGARWRRDGGL